MRYDTIRYELDSDVATITLARPDSLNALNAQMRADLTHALLRAPEEARALLLTGMGRGFCAGQDLGDAANVRDLDLGRTLREEYAPLLRALTECPIPTIAAVNGAAAGAGASLALAADICIAAESASFMMAFARIGLIPDAGGSFHLPRLAGQARAMGMALLAEPVPAAQAAEWGMIWAALPDDDLLPRARARAEALAAGPTLALRLAKQAIRASLSNDFETQLELEAHLQTEAGASRDFLEGVMAFLEKRPASFEGR